MIEINREESDDSQFIDNIEKIIVDKINAWKPNEIYLTKIDNWFDSKWLMFSGTVMHAAPYWRADNVTVPPFHPNRVKTCDFYQMMNGVYVASDKKADLHIIQGSANNLKRKIADFSEDGLFVWYGGNTKSNNHGSVMCYFVKETDCHTFYISFSKDKVWIIERVTGIAFKEAEEILAKEYNSAY
jgi:hypothetical protein